MKRLSQQELTLTRSLVKSPFDDLLSAEPITSDSPLETRIDRLSQLLDGLNALEKECQIVEKTNATLTLGGMLLGGLAVSSCAALGFLGAAVVPIVAGASIIGLLGSAGTQQAKIMKLEKTSEQFRLAISSSPVVYWAALWQIGGTELFMSAVEDAADVTVIDGEIHYKGENPLTKAITKVARYRGWHYDDLLNACETVANDYAENTPVLGQKRPSFPNAPQKPSIAPQQKAAAAIDFAATIGADLAEGVERAKEERRAGLKTQPLNEESHPPVTRIQPSVLPAVDVVNKQTQDIVELILSSVNSLAFIGGQRCGKSLLMAIASRIGVQRGKFKGAFVISSLAKAGEDDHYWQHCATKTFYDLAVIVDKTNYYQQYLDTIRAFKKAANAQNPQLLIIDEFAYLCERLEDDLKRKDTELGLVALELMQEIAELASVVASGGAKRGWYLWLGSPKGAIGNMGRGGKAMKELSLIFCAIPPGTRVDSNGVTVQWDENLCNATALNWKALSKPPRGVEHDLGDRIVWMNGKWYAKSSYTLEAIVTPIDQTSTIETIAAEDALSSNDRQSLKTAVAVQDKSQVDVMIELLEKSKSQTIEEFIQYDLKAGHRINEVKPRIIAVLKRYNRPDLLKRFSVN